MLALPWLSVSLCAVFNFWPSFVRCYVILVKTKPKIVPLIFFFLLIWLFRLARVSAFKGNLVSDPIRLSQLTSGAAWRRWQRVYSEAKEKLLWTAFVVETWFYSYSHFEPATLFDPVALWISLSLTKRACAHSNKSFEYIMRDQLNIRNELTASRANGLHTSINLRYLWLMAKWKLISCVQRCK